MYGTGRVKLFFFFVVFYKTLLPGKTTRILKYYLKRRNCRAKKMS